MAMRHRLHIGTIVSDSMMKVKFLSGGYIRRDRRIFYIRLNPEIHLHWPEGTWNL